MIKTLYSRVVVTFLAVIILSLIISTSIGLAFFKGRINNLGQDDMLQAAKEITQLYKQTTPETMNEFMEHMAKLSSYPIHVFDNEHVLTFYTLHNNNQVTISDAAVQKVLDGETYRSLAKKEEIYVGIPFDFNEEKHAMFLQFSYQNEKNINYVVLFILSLALFIGSFCIVIAARYLVKPLNELRRATQQLAKGDFDVNLDLNRSDEIGELAQSFNEMTTELKQIEQMRQDFISNVSHEIQTPLTSISGFAKALSSPGIVPEENREYYLNIIVSESDRLSRLGESLLKLASLDSDHHPFDIESIDLGEQIRQVVVTCEPQWQAKNIEIELVFPQTVEVSGDKDLLSQVWLNLIGNSIKFTPENGAIKIELKVDKTNQMAIVSIIDTGVGIAREDLDTIFERFYKSDKSRTSSIVGNGLGLAIVKKIIELHDGKIFVESKIVRGTTFTVKLATD